MLPRNTKLKEEGTSLQLEGHPESVSGDAGGMRGGSEPAEYFGCYPCNDDPAERLAVEEEEEEEEGSREGLPERSRQMCSKGVTEALLPKQQSQEGEPTCKHINTPKPSGGVPEILTTH